MGMQNEIVEPKSHSRRQLCKSCVMRLLVSFCICLAVFTLLKVSASAIPGEALHQSLIESADILSAEDGDQHILVGHEPTTRLDNYTTAIMLKICGSTHAQGFEAAVGDYHYRNLEIKDNRQSLSLEDQLNNPTPNSPYWRSYARYWHGYTVVLKPLLVFLNLNQIRMMFVITTAALLLSCSCLLARLRGAVAGVALALPFFAVNFLVASISLSLAFTFLIALSGMLLVLVRFSHSLRASPHEWVVVFFVLGACTAFFDLLCTPIITLGLPLALLVYLSDMKRYGEDGHSFHNLGLLILIAGVCWTLGYGLLWMSKWAISSFVLDRDVFAEGIEQFVYRTGRTLDNGTDVVELSVFAGALRNAGALFPKWALGVLVALIACAVGTAVFFRDKIRFHNWTTVVALFLISLLPYLWYLFASNHSYIHFWFTYRSQVVTLVCCLLALEIVLHPILPGSPLGANSSLREA